MKYQVNFHAKTWYLHTWKWHVKRSLLLWLQNKSHLSQQKKPLNEMVWNCIGVYVINKTLHGRLEIQNFSLTVKKYFTSEWANKWNIFQHSQRNFVSPCGHVISSIHVYHAWLFSRKSGMKWESQNQLIREDFFWPGPSQKPQNLWTCILHLCKASMHFSFLLSTTKSQNVNIVFIHLLVYSDLQFYFLAAHK